MAARSSFLAEPLESRRLFCAASEIGLIDAGDALALSSLNHSQSLSMPMRDTTTTIPLIRRTYTGSFSLSTGLNGTFKLVVRKQDNRGTYAALRGTLDVVTNLYGTLHADMTYGKIRDNLRINMTLVGTTPAFTATITGKASTSGSQLKGQVTITGSVALATTFTISKVVH